VRDRVRARGLVRQAPLVVLQPQPRPASNVAAITKDNPDPQVVPYLLYADAGAAADWLIKVFAFTERARDVPAHRERAQAAGANVSEIGIRANRARSYTVDDPEGHRWYFSEPF
jgi:uncharacterized glyoxalase superfamily protein PhnB